MLKWILVLAVVGVGLWLALGRRRLPPDAPRGGRSGAPERVPQPMVVCAHCGLHLPAADAVLDGSRVYCSEAHRERGPRG